MADLARGEGCRYSAAVKTSWVIEGAQEASQVRPCFSVVGGTGSEDIKAWDG